MTDNRVPYYDRDYHRRGEYRNACGFGLGERGCAHACAQLRR